MNLFKMRRVLRSKTDKESKNKLEDVESKLAEKCALENYTKITEETKDIECDEGGFNSGKFWKLKKKLLLRPRDPPTAMLDEAGNLITSAVGVAKLSVEHYKRVLQNRPMAKKHEELRSEKKSLWEERVAHAKENKSKPWTIKDIEAVLKHLKRNKSRDPMVMPTSYLNLRLQEQTSKKPY